MVVRIRSNETAAKGSTLTWPKLKNVPEVIALHARNPISRSTATPAKPRTRPCFKTIFVTLRGSAPSAMRMPISRCDG